MNIKAKRLFRRLRFRIPSPVSQRTSAPSHPDKIVYYLKKRKGDARVQQRYHARGRINTRILDAESHKPYSRCREPGDQENLKGPGQPGGTPKCSAVYTWTSSSQLPSGEATVQAAVATQDFRSVLPGEYKQAAMADVTSQETCVMRCRAIADFFFLLFLVRGIELGPVLAKQATEPLS